MVGRWLVGTILLLVLLLGLISAGLAVGEVLDFDIPGGHFYKQANGQGGAGDTGYSITNDPVAPLWDEFQRLGGVDAVGYPASRRFVWDGFTSQVMQKEVFQWRPEVGRVYFVNVFDELSKAGKDDWLLAFRQVPKPFDNSPDTGQPWDKVVERHLSYLDQDPAIKARYLSDPDWLNHYGLPQSYGGFGNVFVIRAQRAVFQRWKVDMPWAKAGEATIANGGDIAKEAGLIPPAALATELPPGDQPTPTALLPTATIGLPAPTATPKIVPTPDPFKPPKEGTYQACWWPQCEGTEIIVREYEKGSYFTSNFTTHGPFLNLALSESFVGKTLKVKVLEVMATRYLKSQTYFEVIVYRSFVGEVKPNQRFSAPAEARWAVEGAELIPVKQQPIGGAGPYYEVSWPIEYGQYLVYFKGLYQWHFYTGGGWTSLGGPPPDSITYTIAFTQ